jgi:hypothetical protein
MCPRCGFATYAESHPPVPPLPPSPLPPSPLLAPPLPPASTSPSGRSIATIAGFVLAFLVLAGAGGVGAYLVLGRDSAPGPASATSSAPASSASASSRSPVDQAHADAHAAAVALKGLSANPAGVLATDTTSLVADPRSAVPAGTTVSANEGSWAPDGTGTGGTLDVTVTYPGRSPVTYLAVMVKEASGWKVLATVEVDQ